MSDIITMTELLDHLGLEYTRNKLEICPFCGGRHTLSFNNDKGMWICCSCSPHSHGRVLHFFARFIKGMDEIPSGRKERGQLSREMKEFMGRMVTDTEKVSNLTPPPKKVKANTIPVVPDTQLHAVYSAMANLPFLSLTKAHRKSLLKRGLTDEAIDFNGYRTMPVDFDDAAPYITLYEQEGGEQTRKKIFGEKWNYPARQIQLGLKIAASLISMGHVLKGVPGFYKFGNSWCFWVNPGILIPTRNMKGEIVVWQVRQFRDPKYLTCHCGTLPGAVTETVCRCHFPRSNAPLSPEVPVIFTEGPLKGDVSVCLFGKPVFFACIAGIEVTTDLLNHIEDFRTAGIQVVQNGFDMDKLTNPNVIRGSAKLMKEIRMRGMAVQQLYWGDRYARYKLMSLTFIARTRNVLLPENLQTMNVFDQLCAVAKALDDANVKVCKFESGKKKVSCYWEPETKGIDDYYLSLR